MPVLLDGRVVYAIKAVLEYDSVVRPRVLSEVLREGFDLDSNPDQVGWLLRSTGAFEKRRRHGGSVWLPKPRKLRKLYQEYGV